MTHSISRRQFLQTTAGTAAAAPLCGLAAPQPRYKKAVKLGMVQGNQSLLEKLQLLQSLGFDCVEPSSPNNLDADELLAARDATGITIHGVVDSVHWRKPFSHPDPAVRAEGVAALRTAIDDAHRYGASTVLVVPAVVRKEISYGDAYRRSQEEIRKVLPQCVEKGIVLAFENVWNNFLLSPLEFARYIDEFESEAVGAYFDVGNIVRYGWPEHWVQALGKRIVKLDIKGYGKAKEFGHGIGDGDVDWAAVRRELEAVDFRGWATAEVGGGGRDRLKDIASRMDRVLGL